MPIIEMTVSGMTCGHCVQTVTKAIQAKDPAAKVAIQRETGLVSAETWLDRKTMTQAIEAEGYKVG